MYKERAAKNRHYLGVLESRDAILMLVSAHRGSLIDEPVDDVGVP